MKKIVVSGKEMVKIFLKNGFVIDRINGSHHQLVKIVNGQKRLVTIPVHRNKELYRSIIRSIFKQSGMTEEEFERMFE